MPERGPGQGPGWCLSTQRASDRPAPPLGGYAPAGSSAPTALPPGIPRGLRPHSRRLKAGQGRPAACNGSAAGRTGAGTTQTLRPHLHARLGGAAAARNHQVATTTAQSLEEGGLPAERPFARFFSPRRVEPFGRSEKRLLRRSDALCWLLGRLPNPLAPTWRLAHQCGGLRIGFFLVGT